MNEIICLNEAFADDDSIEDVLNKEYAKGYENGKADGYKQGESDGINIGIDICLALFRGWQTRLATHVSEFGDTLEQLNKQKGAEE